MSTMTVPAAWGLGDRGRAQAPVVRRPSAPGVPATPLRLTRRGRLLLTGLALVLLVVAAVLASGGAPATAGTERGVPRTFDRVTVAPGETLWAIAQREAPGQDPRETIARIVDLNALDSAAVQAGTVLLLPAG